MNSKSNGKIFIEPSHTLIVRLRLKRQGGNLARVIGMISKSHGLVSAMDMVSAAKDVIVRDLTIRVHDEAAGGLLIKDMRRLKGIDIVNVSDRVFLFHLGGKLEIKSRVPLKTREDLSMAYTPGVARICSAIAQRPEDAYALTMKRNSVAIVTDGTAILGLGDLGPEAALPVMEGKAILFKQFANVDAFPLCLATKDTDEIVRTVQILAPAFGGVNLEDISAPRCFEIESRLQKLLDIPVFHDDQHGTAIVVLAALFNSLRLVQKSAARLKIVMSGAGAAGLAVTRILLRAGVKNIIGFDRSGAVFQGRQEHMNPAKTEFARITNLDRFEGTIQSALRGADVFVGLSQGNLFEARHLKNMARDGIVFALANPTPEVDPQQAARYVRIVATGRSDFPNQINNALAFPGVFRGALNVRARQINEPMKLAAARALSKVVGGSELREDYIVPSIFNSRVVADVSRAVSAAATRTGSARVRQSQEAGAATALNS
ncbi:MAG: NAD-dependent malic enzyme [Elusimicrobiota bacterium]